MTQRAASSRACLSLLVPVLAWVGTIAPSVASAEDPAGPAAERAACLAALERVRERYRLWPAGNREPKPAFSERIDAGELIEKARRQLRLERALGDVWRRPLTAVQLQAELERTALNSRRPDLLRAYHEALGDDPARIASCLAAPALAERLARRWFAADSRFHGKLRARVDSALRQATHPEALANTDAAYRVVTWRYRPDGVAASDHVALESGEILVSDPDEWIPLTRRLAQRFSRDELPPIGTIGPLQDEAHEFSVTAMLESTDERRTIGIASWPKANFEDWVDGLPAGSGFVAEDLAGIRLLGLDPAGGASCSDETWTPTEYMPVGRGMTPTSIVWTGAEMVIWGGSLLRAYGDRYDPATDSWTPMSTIGAPAPRGSHTVVWTGQEIVIWGGTLVGPAFTNTGGRYDPVTDAWMPTSVGPGVPEPRSGHRAVWTGSEMLVWGGLGFVTGGRYDPATDTWTPTATGPGVASPRTQFSLIWTGDEAIVWGGCRWNEQPCHAGDGARYDPATDTWAPTNAVGAPQQRLDHRAVWTGSEMIVWGGCQPNPPDPSPTFNCLKPRLDTGGRYDPATDAWTPTSTVGAPHGRHAHTAVWTGAEMIVWGGCLQGQDSILDCPTADERGRRYDPATDSWLAMNTGDLTVPDVATNAVWTGTEMIAYRGSGLSGYGFGARYSPSADSWVPTVRSGRSVPPRGAPTIEPCGRAARCWSGAGRPTRTGSDSTPVAATIPRRTPGRR